MPRPPRDRHKTGNQRERNAEHVHGPRKMKLYDDPGPPPEGRKYQSAASRHKPK